MLTARVAERVALSDDGRERLIGLAVVATLLLAATLVSEPRLLRVAFAASLLTLVLGLGLLSPRLLLYSLPVWLAALGLVRRLLSSASPQGAADPLLIVAPAALVVLAAIAVSAGAFRSLSPLAKTVLLFSGLVVLGALNPVQGSLTAGISALVFFVPLAAFWIGRALCDERDVTRLLVAVGVLAVPAAAYGLFQTFSGFPAWDERWIALSGYEALNVRGTIRPFSSFTSSAEYATYLGIAVVAWICFVRRRYAWPLTAVVVSFLAVAAVYQASRGAIVLLAGSLALMLGARARLPLPAALGVAAAVLALLPHAVGRVSVGNLEGDGPSRLVAHVVEGLSDPFNPEASTAGFHVSLVLGGVEQAVVNPLGYGISSVTIAGSKFGGSWYNTEADPSNAAVALGLPGFVLFLAILVLGFGQAYRLARLRRDAVSLAVLGLLGVTSFQWLNGGKYAVAFLPWLALGWLDRQVRQSRRQT